MSVFGVNLFVLFCHENLEITVCLPFVLVELDFGDLLTEDCFADDCSKKAITDIFVFLVEIHESSKEDREIDDIKEQCL